MSFLKNKITVAVGVLVAFLAMGVVAAMPSAEVSAKVVEINAADYGYGRYVVTAKGVGYDGVYDEDSVVFYYLPVYVSTENDENGDLHLKLEYDADNGGEEGGGEGEGGSEEDDGVKKVAKIEIEIRDESGNIIPGVSPIVVYPPTTDVPLTDYFNNYDLPSGTYQIWTTAYDKSGEELYKPYVITIYYDEEILVPDTGVISQNLNISKTDYLVTALIAFATVTIPGIFIVMNKSNKTSKKSRKR